MPWFVEEMHPASPGWSPAIYRDMPSVGKDMRIKMANGSGPRVRKAPVEISEEDARLPLVDLIAKFST